jgi:hypothetical protein
MVFTLIISPSGCALIDQIQQNQYELRRYQKKIRPASRLSLIGLVCAKRRQSRLSYKSQKPQKIIRSNSWPCLSSTIDLNTIRRCHSQVELNQNNNNYSLSSSNLLNETKRKSITDLTQQSVSISNTSPMYSSQTSVDMLREDKTKVDKWHYFLAG